MKKISLVIVSVLSLFFIACKKDAKCPYVQSGAKAPASETDSLKRFLIANNITDTIRHASGLYYVPGPAGNGNSPSICSDVIVQYQGYLLSNGFQFDGTVAGTQAKIELGLTIEGWKQSIPLLKPGGSFTLYIPPSLAYGAQGRGPIPGNAYLKFTVKLIDTQ